MSAAPTLKLFVDQCVPDSAGTAFKEAGHSVTLLREKIAPDSPDELVAAVAEGNDAILVSLDGDFKKIAQRRGVSTRKFRKLSLIKLSCRESRAAERIRQSMTLIYHEWDYSAGSAGSNERRLFIEIGDQVIRTIR